MTNKNKKNSKKYNNSKKTLKKYYKRKRTTKFILKGRGLGNTLSYAVRTIKNATLRLPGISQITDAVSYYTNLKELANKSNYYELLSILVNTLGIKPLEVTATDASISTEDTNKYNILLNNYLQNHNNCIAYYKINQSANLPNIVKLLLSVHLTTFATELINFTDISSYLKYLPLLDIFIKVNDSTLTGNKLYFKTLSENMNKSFDLSDFDMLLAIGLSILESPNEVLSDDTVTLVKSINYILEILRYIIFISDKTYNDWVIVNNLPNEALSWLQKSHNLLYTGLDIIAKQINPLLQSSQYYDTISELLFIKFFKKHIDIQSYIKEEFLSILQKYPYLNLGYVTLLISSTNQKSSVIQSGGGFKSVLKQLNPLKQLKQLKHTLNKDLFKITKSSTSLESTSSTIESINNSITDIEGLFGAGNNINWSNYNSKLNLAPEYNNHDTIFDIINNSNNNYIILDKIIASISINNTVELRELLNNIIRFFNKKCVIQKIQPPAKSKNFMTKLFTFFSDKLNSTNIDDTESTDVAIQTLNTKYSLQKFFLSNIFDNLGFGDLCTSTNNIDYDKFDTAIGKILLFNLSPILTPILSSILSPLTSIKSIKQLIIKKLRIIFIKLLFNLNMNRIINSVYNILSSTSESDKSLRELYIKTLNTFSNSEQITTNISETEVKNLKYLLFKNELEESSKLQELPELIIILYNILNRFIIGWNMNPDIYKQGLLYNIHNMSNIQIQLDEDSKDVLSKWCLQLHYYCLPISSNIIEQFLEFRIYDEYIFTSEINIMDIFTLT